MAIIFSKTVRWLTKENNRTFSKYPTDVGKRIYTDGLHSLVLNQCQINAWQHEDGLGIRKSIMALPPAHAVVFCCERKREAKSKTLLSYLWH